ncbi:hypothetical protein MAR_015573 [Mya arenaria]|uniref:SAP domain-containing protein n=1 Tax=Mya arenaria TaxID=6604 RepID=A0ABY7FJT8_MYAAR|nr:hypothetical protein MAR_015573 [Mya arenaria]
MACDYVDKENNRYLSDSEIDKLNVSQLKDYLRDHNQYVSGKKSELVLRAKGVQKAGLNDRNEVQINAEVNFEKRQCDKLVTPLGQKLPHPKTLISWTSDLMNIPYFSDSDIYNYFVLKMNTKKQRGEACNHIGAIMYALSDISTKKKDGTIASTSSKCVWDQFNNPRKRKLTPKKSSELKFRKFKMDTEEPSKPKMKTAKELFSISFSEENFRKKLSACNSSAGWLLNFVNSKEELQEEQVPQFLLIEYQYKDSVNLKSDTVVSVWILSGESWSHLSELIWTPFLASSARIDGGFWTVLV